MNRRALDPLDSWPVIRQAEPFCMTWQDHARNVLWLIGQTVGLLLAIAGVVGAVLLMGVVVEGVPR